MAKRFFRAATMTGLLLAMGCLERMCERHGYYKAPPPAYSGNCCVPCCPAAPAGYVAPASGWNAPVAAPAAGTCPPGCVPANR